VIGLIFFFSLREIFQGLQLFLGHESDLVVNIIKELKLGSLLGYFLSLIAGLLWYKERQGKKRAIRQKADFQHQLESKDEFRSSSDLTPTGGTPKEAK